MQPSLQNRQDLETLATISWYTSHSDQISKDSHELGLVCIPGILREDFVSQHLPLGCCKNLPLYLLLVQTKLTSVDYIGFSVFTLLNVRCCSLDLNSYYLSSAYFQICSTAFHLCDKHGFGVVSALSNRGFPCCSHLSLGRVVTFTTCNQVAQGLVRISSSHLLALMILGCPPQSHHLVPTLT